MSVRMFLRGGPHDSNAKAEVVSNLFPDSNQDRLAALPNDSDNAVYNLSHGQNLIRIAANLNMWTFKNAGINKEIWQQLTHPVYGLMLQDFTYSVQSEWEQMDYPAILDLRAFSQLAAFAGGGEMGAVARTQKYWKRSGDIKISPQFRILDVDGNGAVLHYVHILLLMSVSVGTQEVAGGGTQNFKKTVQNVGGEVTTFLNGMINAVPGGTDPSGGATVLSTIKDTASTLTNYSAAGIINNLIENASDYVSLRAAPPPVDVQIGKIFRHRDMVITDVTVVFSKEYTVAGPMYADVTLQLASRKIISNIKDIGLVRHGLMGVDGEPNMYDDISINYKYDGVIPSEEGAVYAPGDVTAQTAASDVNTFAKLKFNAPGKDFNVTTFNNTLGSNFNMKQFTQPKITGTVAPAITNNIFGSF